MAPRWRVPASIAIPESKSRGTIRIFVLGESAAFGDPQPRYALPRMLEAMMELRYPGVSFEVVNAAMTGINSHVVKQIGQSSRGGSRPWPELAECGGGWFVFLLLGQGESQQLVRHNDGRVETLVLQQGPLLGFMTTEACYPKALYQMQAGDLLLLYTDGVTEAPASDMKMFGTERLCAALSAAPFPSQLSHWTQALRKTIEQFTSRPI